MVIKEPASLTPILEFAESVHYEKKHAQQVARLSLKFFDELIDLHKLGAVERFWLHAAALLHDIGWIGGREEHHKCSRDMILQSDVLPFCPEEKVIIALVARYHRKALPDKDHRYYGTLDEIKKSVIDRLAALLRIADGLDRQHIAAVENVRCEVADTTVKILISGKLFDQGEAKAAKKKSDLFERIFAKTVTLSVL